MEKHEMNLAAPTILFASVIWSRELGTYVGMSSNVIEIGTWPEWLGALTRLLLRPKMLAKF